MNKRILINDLIDRTHLVNESVQKFFKLSNDEFNYKPSANAWNIAQIIEHLNISHSPYISYIETNIAVAKLSEKPDYNSGWLGDWWYGKLVPHADGSIKKMKTFGGQAPDSTELDGRVVLARFVDQLYELEEILEKCYRIDMEKMKIPFFFNKFISLRLGDSLRSIVAHNERHLMQANRIFEQLKSVNITSGSPFPV